MLRPIYSLFFIYLFIFKARLALYLAAGWHTPARVTNQWLQLSHQPCSTHVSRPLSPSPVVSSLGERSRWLQQWGGRGTKQTKPQSKSEAQMEAPPVDTKVFATSRSSLLPVLMAVGIRSRLLLVLESPRNWSSQGDIGTYAALVQFYASWKCFAFKYGI